MSWGSFFLGVGAAIVGPWALVVLLALIGAAAKSLPRPPAPLSPSARIAVTGARARVAGATDSDVIDNLLESLP